MLYINLDVNIKEFDAHMYMRDLGRVMRHEFIQAARAFYLAAAARVHVDTGMALASLTGLSRLVGEQLDLSRRNVYRPVRRYNPPGGPMMPKTPTSGQSLGPNQRQIIRVTGTGPNTVVNFHMETNVWHFVVWDTLGFRGQPPWHAFRAGNQAMMARLQTLATQAPPISRYMIATRIRSNSTGGTVTTRVDERRQWTGP